MQNKKLMAGRTLIELLVAIGLGLLILLGVGSLFIGANQSSRVASSIASSEETGQAVLGIMGAAIQRAGYSEIVGATIGRPPRAALLYSGPYVQGCTNGTFQVDGTGQPVLDANGNFNCVAGGTSDSLAVVFQADNVIAAAQGVAADCLGQAAPLVNVTDPDYQLLLPAAAGGQMPLVRNLYDLAIPGGTTLGNLRCRGNGNAATPQALMGNVEQLKVFFGYDDDAQANPALLSTTNPVARTFRTAGYINGLAMPAGMSAWDFVVTVYVCVLVASDERGTTTQATYTPCPQTPGQADGTAANPPIAPPVADGRVRRAYAQIFSVRSRTAPAPVDL